MSATTIVILFLILLGGIIGVLKRESLSPSILRVFPYFLFFQFGYQLWATLYSFVLTEHKTNYPIFNVANLFIFLFFSIFFYKIINSKQKKRFVLTLAIVWVVFYFINLFFMQGINQLMTYSRTMMGAFVVIYALLYFHEMLTDDRNNKNPIRDASFWFVTALFFFYLCSTLTLSLWDYLVINKVYIGSTLLNTFAFLLYAMYIAGFVLHKNVDNASQKDGT